MRHALLVRRSQHRPASRSWPSATVRSARAAADPPTRCASRDISRWWQTRSKNFSRSMSTTHSYPSSQVLLGLLDRRVATTARSEPVTRRVKRRLEHRLEYLPHGLTDHPVDHVRDAQPALAAAHLRDHHPADRARSIAPIQQSGGQPRASDRPLLTQLADRLPIRARAPLCSTPPSQAPPSSGSQPPSIVTDVTCSALTIASGTPARPVRDRSEATSERTLAGLLLSRSAGEAVPPFDQPGSPSLADQDSTRHAQRALPRLPVLRDPPTSAGPSAVVLSSSGLPANTPEPNRPPGVRR